MVASYVLFNYFVDSLSIFHQRTEPFESHSDVNERFLKSLYLEEYCTEINTLIFGDSRTAGYVTDDIEKRFENSRVYNYGVQADTLIGIYQKLKWLAGNECLPERIIIPISINSLKLHDYADDTRLLMQENPAILERDGMGFKYWSRQLTTFKKYLFSSSIFIKNIKYINNHIVNREYHLKFFPSTGDIYYYFDYPCRKIHNKFGTVKINYDKIDSFVNKIRSIYDYADSFGIQVILLWNPQLYDVQMSYELDSSIYLLMELSKISSSINRVPLDDRRLKNINYYHDCSHFKKKLGKSIFDEQNRIPIFDLIKEFKNEHSKVIKQVGGSS